MGKLVRAFGVLITAVAVLAGIALQASLHDPRYGGPPTMEDRGVNAIIAIVAVGIGVLVIAAGQLLVTREAKSN